MGKTVRIPFASARMLSPLQCSTLIYTLKHKLIQIYLIGGGVMTSLEIGVRIDGSGVTQCQGSCREESLVNIFKTTFVK